MSKRSTEWWPSRFLAGSAPPSPYAVLILNQPINDHALRAIAGDAALVVCADGGANRLYDLGKGEKEFREIWVNAVVGDLDSLRPEVEQAYRQKGATIHKDPDQYATDFKKGLKWIRDCNPGIAAMDVVAIGGLGGRVDQGLSQIHHLYLAQDDPQLLRGRLYLLSEQSLSFVLEEGQNTIYIEPGTFDESVGVLPILGPTVITTKGLEWDVTEWHTEFGGQISTSNHIRSDKVQIDVNGRRPLFTVELAGRFTASSQ